MAGEIVETHAEALQELVLVPGHGGVFEVRAGDDVVYDKKDRGGFPQPGEARDLIAARVS